jgi:pSer/pThr/pTyr-binding forkhead associated (FHA) protein
MRSWIIGNSPDCDVVVDSPLASSRHCQLMEAPQGFLLNDLGSTNGTYVNCVRITGATPLRRGDSITLGRTVPFPWPRELMTSIQIGRLPDNDIVLDDPRVSGHHARLVIVPGFQMLIEDMGSSNGTFLNSADRRVTSPTPITESDTLYFGTLAVPAARLLRPPSNPETPAPTQSHAIANAGPQPGPSVALPVLAFWQQHRWLLVWLAQTPVIAILIVLISGGQVGAANWESNARAIAATTFALALAAIWSGGSLAGAEVAVGHAPIRDIKRLAVLAALCAVACAVLLAFVDWGSGLKGPWLAMWGILTVSSLVGLALALAVASSVRNRVAVASLLQLCFLVMIVFGGWIWPLPKMIRPAQMLAESMPTRWAFEGLFLLESEKHSARAIPDGANPDVDGDFVEEYFPADSERMGPAADAMALSSMMIALGALTVFISRPPRVVRSAL